MDTNTLTMWIVVANSVAWMAFVALILFEMNKITFHVQMIAPAGRRHTHRIYGVEQGMIWHKVKPWYDAGWNIVLIEDMRGVGIHTIVLEKFE